MGYLFLAQLIRVTSNFAGRTAEIHFNSTHDDDVVEFG